MSLYAANPAGLSHLSPCPVLRANYPSRTYSYGVVPAFWGGYPCSNRPAIAADFRGQYANESFALERVSRYVPRLLLGHSFGAFPAPGGTRSSASHSAPLWGPGSSQNKFESHDKVRHPNFFRAPPRKQTFGTWEPGPLAKLRPV